jgi:hypothetical protein
VLHNGDALVAFFYVRHNDPFLKQGEIISNLFALKLQIPAETTIHATKQPTFDSINYPYAMIVSQACDLEGDYEARFGGGSEHKLLEYVLFCGLFLRGEIKDESKRKSEEFRRIRKNQNERYHYLTEAPVQGTQDTLPEFVADFKTTFSLPTDFTYWLVSSGQATREGALLSPYLEDFMHRLYSFLGRVATPTAKPLEL